MNHKFCVLMCVMGAALLVDPLAYVGVDLQAPLGRGLGALLVLGAASLALGSTSEPPAVLSGIVMVLEHDTGTIGLQHADGARSHLTADPELLVDTRVGDPVKVLVEGAVVRAIRGRSGPRGWLGRGRERGGRPAGA